MSQILIYFCLLFADSSAEQHMFKDFDYISPELVSTVDKISTQPNSTDISNGASNLTEEMQDLRIRGYGD